MHLAILFWFYKDVSVCRNRLELLRKHNRHAKIYGLFGGDVSVQESFKTQLLPYLDDFYCFQGHTDPPWKWRNGDLLITDWFLQRGHDLQWDSVVVVQWDMLIFGDVTKLFLTMHENEILLSGLRSIKREGTGWFWVSDKVERIEYEKFLQHVNTVYDHDIDPAFCVFIVVVLSRAFLVKYSMVSFPEKGFIEYRVPIYANLFNIPINRGDKFVLSNPGESLRNVVITVGQQIPLVNIARNLLDSSGARVFHPYHGHFPHNARGFCLYCLNVFKTLMKRSFEIGNLFLERYVLWRFRKDI